MAKKRITIYDLARELKVSASYISKALNDHPSVNDTFKKLVKKKVEQLGYKHNSHAANLRQGFSKTIGVIVPHINKSFFSEIISGIEEVSSENNHGLIICQSHDSYKKECQAIDTLIHQNVDCIFISTAIETKSASHLLHISKNNIALIQIDRYITGIKTSKVINDNEEISYVATKHLLDQGYHRIAFIGGPNHSSIFQMRKKGFLNMMNDASKEISSSFLVECAIEEEPAFEIAKNLLTMENPPDAFLTVSDYQALGVRNAAQLLNIEVPKQLGIIGFSNETFTRIISPTISSVDQNSKELGRQAARLYFEKLLHPAEHKDRLCEVFDEVVNAKLIVRESSTRN